jgi:16S rRNA (cytosine1402-N4)-methyltransferase
LIGYAEGQKWCSALNHAGSICNSCDCGSVDDHRPESSGIGESLTVNRFIEDHTIDHIPVLFEPVMQALAALQRKSPVILDGTVGEAGHTRGMLHVRPDATVLAFDRDEEMLERAKRFLTADGFRISERPQRGAVCLFHASFSEAPSLLQRLGMACDFVLCDFGVAMFHFTQSGRGFSFRDAELDMRLDRQLNRTAADLLNHLPEEKLAEIFFKYGEERLSRPIARSIVEARPIVSASQLTDCVLSVMIRKRNRSGRRGFIRDSDAARIFQALRIAVNGELDEIEKLLSSLPAIVKPGGRAALISFHSLEDRLVKKGFAGLQGFRVLTKKPIRPDESELRRNPAARSAKLRIIERTEETS